MADNIAVTAGAGTTLATDDVAGAHHQFVKIRDATLDSVNGLVIDASGRITAIIATLPSIPAGTNNIGDVDLASAIPAGSNLIGQVDLNSVPASARTTDTNSVAHATDKIMNNITELTPKFAKANITASSTDSNIVTAVGGKIIRVLSFRIHTAGTATNVTFNSKPAGAGTAISELFACGANGGRSEGFNPIGHFQTTSGEGLTVTTGAGSTTGIGVTYVEV